MAGKWTSGFYTTIPVGFDDCSHLLIQYPAAPADVCNTALTACMHVLGHGKEGTYHGRLRGRAFIWVAMGKPSSLMGNHPVKHYLWENKKRLYSDKQTLTYMFCRKAQQTHCFPSINTGKIISQLDAENLERQMIDLPREKNYNNLCIIAHTL